MAVQPISTELTLQSTVAGDTRRWVAATAVQDSAAGAALDITVTEVAAGTAPPAVPDTLTLRVRIDNGATDVRSYTLTPGSASQTVSFSFTLDGVAASAARAGTLRMRIEAVRTSGSALTNYNVNSDDTTGQVLPAGWSVTERDQGWVRGTTVLTEQVSNVSAGGAKNQPGEYDESLFVRALSGADSYTARALTVAASAGSLSGATNSTTSATRDVTFTNVVDDRFAAAVTTLTWTVTVPAATLTGLVDWTYTATTDDTINVDPRLTATHHFQVDDNTFGVAKNDTTKSMLSTQSGFLWVILKTARTLAGVNAVTVNQTMTPVGPGTPASQSGATSTQDTQAGVSVRLDWTASKPGGSWNKTTDITAPADIDADTHLTGSTDTLVLLAPDPRLRVVVGAGPYGTAPEDDHWHPGNPLLVGLAVVNSETLKVITPDATPVPSLIVGRFNQTFGRAEFFDVDLTWKPTSGGATLYAWPLAVSAGDAQIFIRVFTVTTAFNTADLFFVGKASVGGTPYSGPAAIGVASTANSHTAYALDATAFALGGLVSFR